MRLSILVQTAVVFSGACVNVRDVRIVDHDGFGSTRVVAFRGDRTSRLGRIQGTVDASCTSDGRLALCRYDGPYGEADEVELIDVGTRERLGSLLGPYEACAWSHDGKTLAVLNGGERRGPEYSVLHVFDSQLNEVQKRPLTLRSDRYSRTWDPPWAISWSADDRLISISESQTGVYDGLTWIVELSSGTVREYPLTSFVFVTEIVGVARVPPRRDACIVRIDGARFERIRCGLRGLPVFADVSTQTFFMRIGGPWWEPLGARLVAHNLNGGLPQTTGLLCGPLCIIPVAADGEAATSAPATRGNDR